MPRPKKDGTYLNCKIATPIHEQLEEHCDETGLSKTVTVEKALELYFKTKREAEKKD